MRVTQTNKGIQCIALSLYLRRNAPKEIANRIYAIFICSTPDKTKAMLEENYITYVMYDRLADSLTPLMKDYSYAAVQVINKIK
jgi:hypothetical protein